MDSMHVFALLQPRLPTRLSPQQHMDNDINDNKCRNSIQKMQLNGSRNVIVGAQ